MTDARTPGVLSEHDKQVIQKTWRLVSPIKETAADLFYKRLFEKHPEYEQLFTSDLHAQKRKLMTMLAFIVRSLDWSDEAWREDVDEPNDLFLVTLALGRRHHMLYHVPLEAYAAVGEALLWTLDFGLGEAFTPEAREAWARVYGLVASIMRMGIVSNDSGVGITAPDSWDKV